jgi:proton glutamate symport protein
MQKRSPRWWLSLNSWIFLGLLGGIVLGIWFPHATLFLKPFRELFLNGIKCLVAPLLFATLVSGIASIGDVHTLGKLGLRCFVYFEIVTTLALIFGLVAVNVIKPGAGCHLLTPPSSLAPSVHAGFEWSSFIEHLLPSNIVDSILRADILQIVIFSCLFGVAALLAGKAAAPLHSFCESLAAVMLKLINLIMYLAPLGIAAAIATALAENGLSIMIPLLKLLLTSYAALLALVILVFFPILLFFRIPIQSFLFAIRTPLTVAFATTSSEAAYPLVLESLERFGIPRRITSFVVPLGYSFNLDGSTLYLAVASVFIAQAAQIELALQTQILMMFSLMLTTKGVAGVPRAVTIVLSGTILSFGLPIEGITLILAIDHLLDMARTFVNVLGNSIACAVMSQIETPQVFKPLRPPKL